MLNPILFHKSRTFCSYKLTIVDHYQIWKRTFCCGRNYSYVPINDRPRTGDSGEV